MATGPGQLPYKAFLSYKHPRDEVGQEFVRRLESALKRYAKPLLQPPIKIFRDEVNMSPAADLSELIRAALGQSEFLLLLASPEAAVSPWVAKEMEIWFGELGRAERSLLIVLLEGEIATRTGDRIEARIDWEQTDALPPNLAPHVSSLPLWVDLRRIREEEQFELDNPEFKRAVNNLVARFRGIDPEEMLGEEVRQHRRTARIRSLVITSLTLITLLAIGAFGWALWEQQRATLELRRTQALLGAAEAQRDAERLPQASFTRLIGAIRSTDRRLPQTETTLRRMLARVPAVALGRLPASVASVAVSADGRWAAAAGGAVALWDLRVDDPGVGAQALARGELDCVLFAPSAPLLVAAGEREVKAWRLDEGTATSVHDARAADSIERLEVAADGSWIGLYSRSFRGAQATRIDLRGAGGAPQIRELSDEASLHPESRSSYERSCFFGESAWSAVNADGSLRMRPGSERIVFEPLREELEPPEPLTFWFSAYPWGEFSHDGSRVGILSYSQSDRRFLSIRSLDGESDAPRPGAPSFGGEGVWSARFHPRRPIIAVGRQNHRIELHDLGGRAEPLTLSGHDSVVTALAFASDGSLLVSGDRQGGVVRWREPLQPDEPLQLPGVERRRGASVVAMRGTFPNEGPLVAFGPDSTEIAVLLGGQAAVRVHAPLDPDSNEHPKELELSRTAELPDWIRETFSVWRREHEYEPQTGWTPGEALSSLEWALAPHRVIPVEALEVLEKDGIDWRRFGERPEVAALSPDRRWAAIGFWSPDGDRLGLWRRSSGGEFELWTEAALPYRVLRFSGDSRWFAIAAGEHVALWRLADGGANAPVELPVGDATDSVTAVAFSPEGTRIAAAAGDRPILLWDLDISDGAPAGPVVIEHAGPEIEELAISPDDRWLVAVDRTWDARVWTLDLERLIASAERRIARPIPSAPD